MGMYFCVDTTLEMGPTGIISGSQYWLCDRQDWSALYTGSETPPADPADRAQWDQARAVCGAAGPDCLLQTDRDALSATARRPPRQWR